MKTILLLISWLMLVECQPHTEAPMYCGETFCIRSILPQQVTKSTPVEDFNIYTISQSQRKYFIYEGDNPRPPGRLLRPIRSSYPAKSVQMFRGEGIVEVRFDQGVRTRPYAIDEIRSVQFLVVWTPCPADQECEIEQFARSIVKPQEERTTRWWFRLKIERANSPCVALAPAGRACHIGQHDKTLSPSRPQPARQADRRYRHRRARGRRSPRRERPCGRLSGAARRIEGRRREGRQTHPRTAKRDCRRGRESSLGPGVRKEISPTGLIAIPLPPISPAETTGGSQADGGISGLENRSPRRVFGAT